MMVQFIDEEREDHVVRRLHTVCLQGPCDCVVPVDPGASPR